MILKDCKDISFLCFGNDDSGDLFYDIPKSVESHPLLVFLRICSGALCVFLDYPILA